MRSLLAFTFPRQLAVYFMPLLILLLLANSSSAYEASDTKTLTPAIVNGVTGSFQARYKDLLRGFEVFRKQHLYAPRSKLVFFVAETPSKEPVPPLDIKFETRNSYYDVRVNNDNFFSLPSQGYINFKDSAMLANRIKGSVAVYPIVRTPADGPMFTHLGDLRLECEVSWAIGKAAVPFYIRGAFFTAGRVCHSKHISVSFYSPKPLRSATMRSGQRTKVFGVGRDGHSYWIPIYDKTWPDDSVVQFNYAN